MVQHIVVTGGNSGIGLALCEQLANRGCKVYLGSRDAAKGEAAVKAIKAAVPSAAVELLQIDVGSDASVATAAAAIGSALGGEQLYAIVNNAGTGLAHGVDSQTMINTNFYGPKRVVAAFLPLLTSDGRIVNVGSGAGPSYIKKCTDRDVQQTLCSAEATWEQIEQAVQRGLKCDGRQGYGCSKAGVGAYTMLLARSHPGLLISCVSPGFIDTAIVSGYGATKPPAQGTVSIHHCLFESLGGSGWYFGSDAVRSPLHFLRNPGEPAYDGAPPAF